MSNQGYFTDNNLVNVTHWLTEGLCIDCIGCVKDQEKYKFVFNKAHELILEELKNNNVRETCYRNFFDWSFKYGRELIKAAGREYDENKLLNKHLLTPIESIDDVDTLIKCLQKIKEDIKAKEKAEFRESIRIKLAESKND